MSIRSVVDYKQQLMSLYWEIRPVINRFYQIRKKIERDTKLTKEERTDILRFIDGEMAKLVDDGNGKTFIIPAPSPNR